MLSNRFRADTSLDERFRVDVGRAGGGKSFARVTDIATGISSSQVGLDCETVESIAQRLAAFVLIDIQFCAAPNSSHLSERNKE